MGSRTGVEYSSCYLIEKSSQSIGNLKSAKVKGKTPYGSLHLRTESDQIGSVDTYIEPTSFYSLIEREAFKLPTRCGRVLMLSCTDWSTHDSKSFIASVLICWSLAASNLSWQTIRDLFILSWKLRHFTLNQILGSHNWDAAVLHTPVDLILGSTSVKAPIGAAEVCLLESEIDVVLDRKEVGLSGCVHFVQLSPQSLRHYLLFHCCYVIHLSLSLALQIPNAGGGRRRV